MFCNFHVKINFIYKMIVYLRTEGTVRLKDTDYSEDMMHSTFYIVFL